MVHKTLSTLRWRVKINVTSSISYETENDLLERGVCSIHLLLCHCASLIHANSNFFLNHYLLEMMISLMLTSD